MPNGAFEPLAQGIQAKIIREGIDGVSEKELLVLLIIKIDSVAQAVRQPFWKTWTIRELSTAGAAIIAFGGIVNWDKLSLLLTTIASAAGAK